MESKTSKLWNRSLLLSGLFAVLFAVFPFWSGLYFEVPTAYSVLFAALVTLTIGIWAIVRKAEAKGFALIDWLVLGYTLVTLLTVFTFSNLEFTLTGIARQFGFLFVYLIVRLLSRGGADAKPLLRLVALSGAIFSVYGILAVTHVIDHAGALFSGTGEVRVASVFEYPNAYASYLAVALLFGLTLQTEMRKPLTRFLWLSINLLTFTGLVLTYSRGGWIVFAGTLVLMLIFAPKGKRVPLTVHSIAAFVSTAAGLPLVIKGAEAGTVASAATGVAIAVAVALLLGFLLERLTNRLATVSIKKGVLIPSLIVVLLGGSFAVLKLGLLPENVVNRIVSINFQLFSVQQRLVFYKDGLSAVQDHPVIGAGDRTWEATFYKYQSYPYYTTSPHSVLIDQVMNVGLLGTLLLLSIVGVTVWSFWKLRKGAQAEQGLIIAALFAAFIEVFGHAVADVDFNYGVITYLFWILIALAALRKPVVLETPNSINSWKWSPQNRWVWWTVSAVTLVVLLFNGSYVYAHYHLEQAKSHFGEAGVAYEHLDKAQGIAPYINDVQNMIKELDVRYYERTQDPVILKALQDRLKKMPDNAPYTADLLMSTGQDLYKYQKPLDGYELMKRAWESAPFRSEYANQLMVVTTQIGDVLMSDPKEKDRAKAYFQETIDIRAQVAQRIAGFTNLPSVLKPERPYAISGLMNQNAAVAAYYLKRYREAEQWANLALQDPTLKKGKAQAVRLLAEKQQNKRVDPALLQQVLKDPEAAQLYQRLEKQL